METTKASSARLDPARLRTYRSIAKDIRRLEPAKRKPAADMFSRALKADLAALRHGFRMTGTVEVPLAVHLRRTAEKALVKSAAEEIGAAVWRREKEDGPVIDQPLRFALGEREFFGHKATFDNEVRDLLGNEKAAKHLSGLIENMVDQKRAGVTALVDFDHSFVPVQGRPRVTALVFPTDAPVDNSPRDARILDAYCRRLAERIVSEAIAKLASQPLKGLRKIGAKLKVPQTQTLDVSKIFREWQNTLPPDLVIDERLFDAAGKRIREAFEASGKGLRWVNGKGAYDPSAPLFLRRAPG